MLIDPGIRSHAHRPCDQYAKLLYSASTDGVDGVIQSREGLMLQPANHSLKKYQYKEIGKGLYTEERRYHEIETEWGVQGQCGGVALS